MASGAAGVVRWPPEQQICRELIEAVEGVMEAQRRQREWLDRRRQGTTGDQAETGLYERPSCKESVFGKMLAMCNERTYLHLSLCGMKGGRKRRG